MPAPKNPKLNELKALQSAIADAEKKRVLAERAKAKQKRDERDAIERNKAYQEKLKKFHEELQQNERYSGFESPLSTFLDIQRLTLKMVDLLLDSPKQFIVNKIKNKIENLKSPEEIKFVPPVLYHAVNLDATDHFHLNASLKKLSSGALVSEDIQAKYDAVVLCWLKENGYSFKKNSQNDTQGQIFSTSNNQLLTKVDFEALRDGKVPGKIGLSDYFQQRLNMELAYEQSHAKPRSPSP